MPTYTAQAAWTGHSIIDHPVIECAGGRIVSVSGENISAPSAIDVDFEDALILPGFINAHSHLEYSYLQGKISAGTAFPEWLRQLMEHRNKASEDAVHGALQTAIETSARNGTTTLLDIATTGLAPPKLAQAGLRAWAFFEVIAMGIENLSAVLSQLTSRVGDVDEFNLISPGVSPHAPYTVSLEAARSIAQQAYKLKMPIAMHLAETREERQMLECGAGPLVEMFREFHWLPANWQSPGISPVQWTAQAEVLGQSTFAIHCNYLDEEDIELLRRSNTSIVYCPASHQFFNHPSHPIESMLRNGINVCIGTDSLASNFSLNLLDELRLAHEQHPSIPAIDLFKMIGANVARPLGLEGQLGVIQVGAMADFTILRPCPMIKEEREMLTAILEDTTIQPVAAVVDESLL